MTKILITFFWASLFLYTTLPAQEDLDFTYITEQNSGLPDNRVYCSFIDSEGCMWFGTHVGLVRYFGDHFKVYLKGEIIRDIVEDNNKNLWIASWGNGLHRLNYHTENIKTYNSETTIAAPLKCDVLKCLEFDKNGKLWIGNANCGLHYFDPVSETFANYLLNPEAKSTDKYQENTVQDMLFDENGKVIWLASQNGVYKFNTEKRKVIQRDTHPNGGRTPFIKILKQEISNNSFIWLGTYGSGICRYDKQTGNMVSFYPNLEKRQKENWDFNVVVDLTPKSAEEIWFYDREKELGIFNTSTHIFKYIGLKDYGPISEIGVDGFLSIDSQNRLWVGRTSNGIAVHDPNLKLADFTGIPKANCQLPFSNRVTSFAEAPAGDLLYVATAGCTGLHIFKKEKESYVYLKTADISDSEERNAFTAVAIDNKGDVWLGAKFKPNPGNNLTRPSLWHYLPEKNLLTPALLPQNDKFDVMNHTVADVRFDPNGDLWLAVNEVGLIEVSFQNRTEIIHQLPGLHSELLSIINDQAGSFWIATSEDGVYKFDKNSKKVSRYEPNPKIGWSAFLSSVALGDNDKIWLGTDGQYIVIIDPKQPPSKAFSFLGEKEGLPFGKVDKIVRSNDGQIWVSTEKGLCKYDRSNHRFINFTEKNGLKSIFFYRLGLWVSKDGSVFAGQANGFCHIPANRLEKFKDIPKVVFTKVKVFEEERHFEQGLNSGIPIHLTHQENFLSIAFSTISYSHQEKNYYKYKIEGLREDWVELAGATGTVYLTDLAPGSYKVNIMAANLDGIWSEPIQLKIRILPPWWQTWWAKIFYLAALTALGYAVWRFQLNKKLMEAEAKRLKELDAMKSELYGNVTHEFRTPLTLIIGQAKRFINHVPNSVGSEAIEAFKSIAQNGQRLLNLVNQMLDVRKLEAGSLQPHWVKGNFIAFLRYITESFSSMAQNKSIDLVFISSLSHYEMDYDKDKTMKIMSNLLSNALKFTHSQGRITVEANEYIGPEEKLFTFTVKDTGIGIQADHLSKIFDRFYQIDSSSTRNMGGTGIGLSLTKELVELLGGTIEVESIPAVGSAFTVSLPIHKAATIADSEESIFHVEGKFDVLAGIGLEFTGKPVNSEDREGKPLILIVEDNQEVAHFIATPLLKKYQVCFAENGKSGIEMAIDLIPDLVISDVMMPGKDGFEVCQTLKTDERTSHIPVIMLTAKAEAVDRLRGLRRGADAYLSKPFEEEELLVNIERSLHLRKVLQRRYSTLTLPLPEEHSSEENPFEVFDLPAEDAFLQKVLTAIEENLSDSGFGPYELCRILALSTSQMHRKLKAVTDITPVDLIRKLRLKKAKHLLKTPGKLISDVANEVGFSEHAYFTKIFTKEFGMNPSEFKEKS